MTDLAFEERLRQIRERCERLKAIRKTVVDPAAWTPFLPKVAFKLAVYREALIWRASELATAGLAELEARRLLAAQILVRSLFETSCALFYASRVVKRAYESDNPSGVDEKLMRLLMGTRWKDWEHQALNILNMIDELDKEANGARFLYDSLSEVAHPNWMGTAGTYSKPDKKNFRTNFGDRIRREGDDFTSALNMLDLCLMEVAYAYDHITDLLPAFADFCRKHFEQSKP